MTALYTTSICSVHDVTTFGHFYRTLDHLDYGCLKCWWDEKAFEMPAAGTSLHSELVEDSKNVST